MVEVPGEVLLQRADTLSELLGRNVVNIPGASSSKETIFDLADQIGSYLNLPVDKKPKVAFFNKRVDWGSS